MSEYGEEGGTDGRAYGTAIRLLLHAVDTGWNLFIRVGEEMMESIDKLRRCAEWYDNEWVSDDGTRIRWFNYNPCDPHARLVGDELRKIADEIEAEIAERYMELPIDADGVPIRMGDYITDGDSAGIVEGFVSSMPNGNGYPVPIDIDRFMYIQCISHHVKQRAIEDVLRELLRDTAHYFPSDCEDDIARAADEIRGLL